MVVIRRLGVTTGEPECLSEGFLVEGCGGEVEAASNFGACWGSRESARRGCFARGIRGMKAADYAFGSNPPTHLEIYRRPSSVISTTGIVGGLAGR
jgi:hypothetical protein